MKKKWMDLVFTIAFMLMITVPLLMLNTAPEVESIQENRMLTSWPGIGFNREINEWYGHYFEDRIGLRSQAVTAYTSLTYHIFGEFAEDMHMFGTDGYVFPADEGYIEAYQRLRTDEELIGNFTKYLKRTKVYLQQREIPFVFLACLDKKTVYPEYMPSSIHVQEDNESIMESLAAHLERADVPYVIPVEEYMREKQTKQLYNRMYDCAHWNDLGRMTAIRMADEKLAEQGLDMPVIDETDYDLTYEQRDRLEFVEVPIDEQVPVYHLKKQPTLWDDYDLTANAWLVEGTSIQYYSNSDALKKKRILIFHDSFLQDAKEFYCARYSQVFFVSRQNYECVQYYVNLIRPDAVIFENAERAFVDDLYAYTNLANVWYEPPYESFADLTEAEAAFQITLTAAENAEENDGSSTDEIRVKVDDARSYFVLQGEVLLPQELHGDLRGLHLYAKYKKRYYEINYPALTDGQPGVFAKLSEGQKNAAPEALAQQGDADQSGRMQDRLAFYMNMRIENKKEIKGGVQMILVDESTHTEYVVGTLELRQ